MHLTDDTYGRLLTGSLPPQVSRALSAHLAEPCEACEDLLRSRRAVDRVDGALDRALLSLAPVAAGAAGQDLEYARIARALRAGGPPAAPPRRAPRVRLVAVAAAAVAVAGLAGLLRAGLPAPPAWDGEKGTSVRPVPLRLRFLVVTPGAGGTPSLERGLTGQVVPASASLQFQVELGREAHVLLARAGRGGEAEVFLATRLPAGRHVIALGGRPAAYPLASLAGRQRFLALASEAPVGAAEAARALAPGPPARRDEGPPISLDEVEVHVRP